jgi:NAD(P)-dependent dehydrogenase (short-subunit alcohol dehydrogenase family)
MKLQNKVASITGATKGIGVACAQELAVEGAKVVACGRSADLGEAVVADIRAAGGDAIFVQGDVSKKAEVDALVVKTAKTVKQYEPSILRSTTRGSTTAPTSSTPPRKTGTG